MNGNDENFTKRWRELKDKINVIKGNKSKNS